MATATATVTPAAAHKSFWKSIGAFFKKTGYYISEAFQKLFGQDAAKHFAVATIALLKSDLGKIVTAAVREAAALATGVDKRSVAFDKIVAAAKSAGIEASSSIINMLIELAVQYAKDTFGQTV